MLLTGSETRRRYTLFPYTTLFRSRRDGNGICFAPSTGFALPNGARRSPDASWMKRVKWERLTLREQKRFAPICPDFVVELSSDTDRLSQLLSKMEEYIANGAAMGW